MRQDFSGTATVTIALTTVATFNDLVGCQMALEVENAGATNTTDQFVIDVRDREDGEWYAYLSGSDFDSALIPAMIFCSTTGPHELPAAGKAHVHVNVGVVAGVRIRAAVAGAAAETTTINVKARFGDN